ncbi:MAG: bifunctional phosphopantothenoylcysteine decarboxylase/phosphopantothenate--cysteine ligase CoaBC [Peptostreptococcaceae bacterium]|nr:bifunctional phosphopantothenoylcysteine decarboxylase/phosphopantothenate--cysteine ligase CoaBC [Peptostreptococcaceae bacterium]MDY5738803.1 bifunctional phosphopantothenoylcysteine decarboxylase/phosphopantothenate--cysteine ligase CoaBC [Anaerovoracaceae bacterium]
MLTGKTVILGVTGGIAAFKSAALASKLVKLGADVHVIMTENAVNFINPITFETLTGNKCITNTFDRNFRHNVEHVALAKKADLFIIAPATANTIAKLAYGLADNMLTTTFLACKCPRMVSPAMNTEMFNNPITKENMERLDDLGITVIPPAEGYLACGDTGTGKMPEPDVLIEYIEREIGRKKDLQGIKILLTAGATREAMDPVRFITNHSTGKMGCAIAREAMLRGAQVVMVKANTTVEPPRFIHVESVVSSGEMFEKCKKYAKQADVIIKSAAVSDYRPADVSTEKVKKKDGDLSIQMERTVDILKYLGENKLPEQVICGFSMETENLVENSRKKLVNKHADLIVANNLKVDGAGFGTDTNIVTLIGESSDRECELMSKEQVAGVILDEVLKIYKEKRCR